MENNRSFNSCDSILKIPIFEELKDVKGPIILAGCGGGFDVYTGIPFYFALKVNRSNSDIAN